MIDGARVRLVCLDVDGTLTDGIGGPALPGAVEAVASLRARWPVRFVTNATSRPTAELFEHLRRLGFSDEPSELVTPVTIARQVLPERGHDRGLLLADPDARSDFGFFREDPRGDTVLLATEGHALRIEDLQPAFRALLCGGRLYSLTKNRYFRRRDELVTDLGPLAAFLAYASGVDPEILGKPSPLLFDRIASEAGVPLDAVLMVGDDAEFDASASVSLGMQGVLVRSGKYRSGDEKRVDPPPSATIGAVSELPSRLRA